MVKGREYRVARRAQLQAIIEREFADEREARNRSQTASPLAKKSGTALELNPALLDDLAQNNIKTLADADALLLVIDDLLQRADEEMVILLMMEAV